MNQALFSSASEEWATPQDVFDALDAEFHFTLDPCSTDENAKCEKHFTRVDDGLSQDWTGERVFCNPPYGREMPKWIAKCAEHGIGGGCCGYANTCQNRYKGFSRAHLRQSRDSVHPRQIEIRRREKLRAVPVNDRGIRKLTIESHYRVVL